MKINKKKLITFSAFVFIFIAGLLTERLNIDNKVGSFLKDLYDDTSRFVYSLFPREKIVISIEDKEYKDNYFKTFGSYPSEITILTYDALGLIYYAWKKNGKINSTNDFLFKNKIKGKIGTFSFKNGKVTQELEIYKTDKKKFIKF